MSIERFDLLFLEMYTLYMENTMLPLNHASFLLLPKEEKYSVVFQIMHTIKHKNKHCKKIYSYLDTHENISPHLLSTIFLEIQSIIKDYTNNKQTYLEKIWKEKYQTKKIRDNKSLEDFNSIIDTLEW